MKFGWSFINGIGFLMIFHGWLSFHLELPIINVELYSLVLAQGWKKDTIELGSQSATLGASVRTFINVLASMFSMY
jgi:hypothetical protein